MKKTLSLVLAAVMLLITVSFAGCSGGNDLVVYTEAGFAPYEFYSDNEIVGVDMSIMKAVADKLGKKLVIKDVPFDSICAAVESGKADVGAAAITIRPDRQETVDFSVPYSSTEQYIIVPADNDTVKFAEDLVGKKIGVQQGTTSDLLVSDLVKDTAKFAGASVTAYKDPATAVAAIPNKVDVVVTDKLTAQIAVANSNGKVKTFKLTNADGSDVAEVEEYGIAVAKGNTELLNAVNEVLNELLANGTIDKWTNEFTELANSLSGNEDANTTAAAGDTASSETTGTETDTDAEVTSEADSTDAGTAADTTDAGTADADTAVAGTEAASDTTANG